MTGFAGGVLLGLITRPSPVRPSRSPFVGIAVADHEDRGRSAPASPRYRGPGRARFIQQAARQLPTTK